jgi:hypothetical protein
MENKRTYNELVKEYTQELTKPLIIKRNSGKTHNEIPVDTLNRVSNEFDKIQWLFVGSYKLEAGVKLLELYVERERYRIPDEEMEESIYEALQKLKSERCDNTEYGKVLELWSSQPFENIVDEYAKFVAYRNAAHELHNKGLPPFIVDTDKIENVNIIKVKKSKPTKNPFNVKLWFEKEYPGGLVRMFNHFKNLKEDDKGRKVTYFANENENTFLDRCNNLTGGKVKPMIVEAEAISGSDRLVLLAMLRAIQETMPRKAIAYQDFVEVRFGIKNWDFAFHQHHEKNEFSILQKMCESLIKDGNG